ncbi:GNAT family N-acetyltransferase [Mycobacteroides abscessus]|uniref:GNAT family N-acetyltransferase n=1 Tax=Mycobacteroides abscessus TaxID=36809 RepID=A0ABD7HPN8_9MYCO|nr:GNAT family N-acetyltransferase [Mycobacteroides abscessus]AWG62976.1 GNAT family N-acetyltransferase [Mycobacteroides abscessus]PVA29575.1 GNAT family N-acetyltransferase [Mycobacteroides abscessus]PVA43482.1 GNAT family N-acetyltransferase [Mycobacteroides abscessus]PVA73565.1 GNAT family N-acetyltransferase [Mycobacteroides abscessus]PVB12095.1 GNAT family N-acetyltransferase [Mycobacteroides abscessus]
MTTTGSIDVARATDADVPEMSGVLARAFGDDPVWGWLLRDPARRAKALPRMFTVFARHHHLAGGGVEVARKGGALGAIALWDPPGRWRHTWSEQLRAFPSLIRALGARVPAALRLDEAMQAAHPEEPHWYLAVIGSDPSLRGKGFGQALMRSGLDRCDAQHAPAYLESSKPANVPYYMRFGFEVMGEIRLPGGGPTLIPMWRQAR